MGAEAQEMLQGGLVEEALGKLSSGNGTKQLTRDMDVVHRHRRA
jgi:hypothetical protein